MGFCGTGGYVSSDNADQRTSLSECLTDVLTIGVHVIFVSVAGVVALARWLKTRSPCDMTTETTRQPWVRFPGHMARWLLTLIALGLNVMELCEGVLADVKAMTSSSNAMTSSTNGVTSSDDATSEVTSSLHLYVTPAVVLVSGVFSLAFYDFVETFNLPRLLLMSTIYWLGALTVKLFKLVALYEAGLGVAHVRVGLTWCIILLYLGLVMVELFAVKKLRYVCTRQSLAVPEPELNDLQYVHPYTNFLSNATWHWLTPLLLHGYKRPLEMIDLGRIPKTEHSKENFENFKEIFEEEKENAELQNRSPSLWRCFVRAYWGMMLIGGVYKLFSDLFMFVAPMCLDGIITFLINNVDGSEQKGDNTSLPQGPSALVAGEYFSNGYVLALVSGVATMLQVMFLQYHYFLTMRQGVRCKGAIQSLVYDKALRLSTWSLGEGGMTPGTVMNHMAVDSAHIFMLFYMLHFTWSLPLQVIVVFILLYIQLTGVVIEWMWCWYYYIHKGDSYIYTALHPDLHQFFQVIAKFILLYIQIYFSYFQVIVVFILLYIQLGYSALISASLVLFLCPFQYFVGKKLAQVQKETLEKADERLKKSNEVLQSIKLLKLYAWEAIFRRSILKTRHEELKLLLRAAFYRVASICIVDGAPVAATFITFTIYPFIENKPLEAAKVFSSLTLFNILGLPLYIVTMIINTVAHARVSAARLLPFLLAPEVKVIEGSPELNGKVMGSDESRSNGTLNEMTEMEKIPDVDIKPITIPSITFDLAPDIDQNAEDEVDQPLLPKGGTPQNQNQPISEPDTNQADKKEPIRDENTVAIEIDNATFSWNLNGEEPVVHDVNVAFPKGKLTVVVGSVGSGKSSILSAVLGEMTIVTGAVHNRENLRLAYGAQKAWLINATLRDNILFGHHYDADKYDQVIQCCALEPDISILPAGDMTEIGEKGINLSGGQKQRLSIARTLYSGADVIILDDPLSALDVHVGSHIFRRAVLRYLLGRDKTVLLVTHQLQYLPYAHKILVMKDGRVQHNGTLAEIKRADPELYSSWNSAITQSQGDAHGTDTRSVISGASDDETASALTDITTKMERISEFRGQVPIRSALSMVSLGNVDDMTDETDYLRTDDSSARDTPDVKDPEMGKLVEEEERAMGSVSARVYIDYAKAATWTLTILTIVGYTLRQAIRMGTDYWLAEWSEASRMAVSGASRGTGGEVSETQVHTVVSLAGQDQVDGYPNTTYVSTVDDFDVGFWIRGYAYLCIVGILLSGPIILCLEAMCLYAARNLHNSMITSVVNAPMRFFDTTPIGRIINRLAGDTSTIDERMPFTVDSLLFSLLYVLGGIIVNAVSMPFFIIPAVPMVLLFLGIQRFFIASSRELQRLDNITRSPILAHFSETLGGLSTIRAYRHQRRFQQRNWEAVDQNNTAFLYLHTANVWMGVRLDLLGALIIFVASVCSITSSLYGFASPSIAGLAIAYSIMISAFLNWTMRSMSEMEMWFSCVQRVDHYCHITSEPYHQDGEVVPASSWPARGEIRFERVSLRYDSSLDPVIRQLSLHIKAGEKIGICGRTGSGKSSLTLGLFRLIDVCEGHIFIDDIDICKVPLDSLRSRLSIIPQDPVLFAGSIRYNLDPDGQYSDEEVWKAIEIAQLKDTISGLSKQLDATVTDGGENFSQGQRQLFCLARAFLRDSCVLVMDEATASIDMETDSLIQEVMKTAFKDRTVITIAHRVATILNSDSVIVIQSGEIIEHDTPQNLLATDSIFASMVQDNK